MTSQFSIADKRKSAPVLLCFRAAAKLAGTVRCFGILVIILMSMAGVAQAQDDSCSECKPRVWIGFNGSICSSGHYKVLIQGFTAKSGTGTCSADSFNPIGDVLVKLTVDYTYQFQVTNACATHLNFYDVPEDYTLEIDKKETRTIDKGGNVVGEGDGIWNVTVRRKCKCGDGNAGESSIPKLSSLMWDVGLGALADGRSAGSLGLRATGLDQYIYTPATLIYSPPGYTNEIDVVQNQGGSLRQVKAPQALADIVTIDANQYEIRFYRHADVGAKDQNGIYTVSNQPFVTWRISNPHVGFTDQLQISKTQNGVTESSLYTWNSANFSWTLTTGTGSTARTESKTEVTDPGTGDWTQTYTVTNSLGQVISKVARTYHLFPWKEELIKEVVDPDNAALTTQYVYYQNSAETGKFRRLKSVTNPDGSWEQYDYDSIGNQVLVLRPWKDQPLGSASEATSYAVRKTYSNYDGIDIALHARFLSSSEEKIAGVTVRKTTYSRTGTTINDEPAVVESVTSYASATVSQTTITTRYHSSASDFYANRIVSVQYPDGKKDSYIYEKGNYVTNPDPSLNQFTPDQNGLAQRETVVHGTSASPDGVAFKSTKETSVRDQFGHGVLQESHVYTGSGYSRLTWSVMDYDDRGHVTQSRRSNGAVVTATWDGDRKTADTDENGIETTYTYDSLNRIATRTKKGIAAGGGFPAQSDIVTTYTYDPEGHTKSETITSGGLTLSRSMTYDVAGRLKTETDSAGLVTSHAYSNGGRTETITLPGGASRSTDKYLDGKSKSVLGTAVVNQYFDYGVNADSTPYFQVFVGSAGLSSPRWTKTTTDWLGRTIKTEKPSFTAGINLVQSFSYNALGQLQAESVTANAIRLQADKLYEYDALGNQVRVGSDIDNSGTLTLSSTDRIVDTDFVLQQNGNDWFKVTTGKTYLVNADPTATTLATGSARITNFAVNGTENTISDVTTTDVAGNQTRSTTIVDRAAKKTISRSDTPDSDTDAVSITVNGLLQSSAPAAPVSATTYSYDALARPVSVIDLTTGTNSNVYNPTTGQLSSESHGSQTTSYEYYPALDTNAGRLKTRTNANGNKIYFAYNSRGDLIRAWGDATYPIEYVFDAYGQKSELHTFRGGSGWQGNSWPASTTGTIDVTRWIYQETTGLLTQKQDATAKQTAYTYDNLGRIATRRWARLDGGGNPIITTYSYDPNSAEMSGISYSDGTPSVTFTYDRGGRQNSLVDSAGNHTLMHNAAGQLQSDEVAGGLLDGVTVTVGYDGFLRRNSLQSSRNAATLVSQTYGYDTASRLQTITSGGQIATYAYYPTSGLLNTTTFANGTQVTGGYDTLGRFQSIATTTPASGTVASYVYTYNNLDQRTRVTREDGSYWSYVYNDRGEVTSGKKFWSDNSLVAGQQSEYVFDSIGNRTTAKAGGDAQGVNLRTSTYTANSLNQYQQRTVPGALDVLGTSNAAATVTVNDQATYRRGDYYYKELAVDNSLAPAYQQVTVVGVKSGVGGAGEDAINQITGRMYVPKNAEVYAYDADGNLSTDGRWSYTWDAENRLTSMQAIATVAVAAKLRLEFAYDWMGRRIQKKVYVWNVGTGTYQLQTTTKFVYDGWSLTAELDGNNNLLHSYVWAGGRILLINASGNTYQVGYDANQNVGALVKASTGTISASYDYDPFGQTLKATGEYASQNPLRFSSQYTDAETSLVYYGYRYYNPQTGRWISRDPAEEEGGLNLSAFVTNDGVNNVDYLGLWKRDNWSGGWFKYSGRATAEECDKLTDLAKWITGDENDWKLLNHSEKVKAGEVIDISPLLRNMESKLRTSVRRAVGAFNPAGFPYYDDQGRLQATGWIVSGESQAAAVGRFFNRNQRYGVVGCDDAASLILTQGLINVIGANLYDEVLARLGHDVLGVFKQRQGKVGTMLEGDSGWLPNYDDYQGLPKVGDYGHENSIKLAQNLYFGHPLGRYNIQRLETLLRNAYVEAGGARRTDPIPGLHNREDVQITFIDVAKVFGVIFDIRRQ